jgi:hypothetical protein
MPATATSYPQIPHDMSFDSSTMSAIDISNQIYAAASNVG